MIGHKWAVDLLAEHVALGRERHAYLFTGPEGVGRRTLALHFAQSLNCLNPPAPGQPCQKCSACKRIEVLQHPDLTVVETEHEGEVLRVDQMRELQHSLSLAPYEARYRVALILRFEEAHSSAANAMLKTLEEPPPQVVVVLTAKSAENLLPTIVSRCEVLRLRPLSVAEIAEGLRITRGIPIESADRLAHISGGRPGYAIRLLEQPMLLEQRQAWLDELLRLIASSRGERFAFAKDNVDNKEELRSKLQIWLTLWRDIFINAAGITDPITNLDYSPQIKKLADEIGLHRAHFYVNSVESTMDRIEHNVNSRLALEVLLMDFPRINYIG